MHNMIDLLEETSFHRKKAKLKILKKLMNYIENVLSPHLRNYE